MKSAAATVAAAAAANRPAGRPAMRPPRRVTPTADDKNGLLSFRTLSALVKQEPVRKGKFGLILELNPSSKSVSRVKIIRLTSEGSVDREI